MTAPSLTGTVKASIQWANSQPLDETTITDNATVQPIINLTDGTGALKIHQEWSQRRTVAAGANDDIDLTNLSNSVFGTSIVVNFTSVKAILIYNRNTASGDKLNLDSSVANACTAIFNGSATSKTEIGPQSPQLLCNLTDAWTVDGTHKILRVHNPSADSITYDIVILGN